MLFILKYLINMNVSDPHSLEWQMYLTSFCCVFGLVFACIKVYFFDDEYEKCMFDYIEGTCICKEKHKCFFDIKYNRVMAQLDCENQYPGYYTVTNLHKHDNIVGDSNKVSDKPVKIPASLKKRMEYYENMSEKVSYLVPQKPYIVLLDGKSFENKISFFDDMDCYSTKFEHIMLLTSDDLLHRYHPATVYTYSDKIMLIFDKVSGKNTNAQHFSSGNVKEIIEKIGNFASQSFYKHLISVENNNEPLKFSFGVPTFATKVVTFPNHKTNELINYVFWMSKCCSKDNFINLLINKYCMDDPTNYDYLYLTTDEKINLLTKKNISLDDDIKTSIKYGIFLKKSREKSSLNKTIYLEDRNPKFSMDFFKFLTAKFLNKKNNYVIKQEMITYDKSNYDQLFNGYKYEKTLERSTTPPNTPNTDIQVQARESLIDTDKIEQSILNDDKDVFSFRPFTSSSYDPNNLKTE